MRITSAFRRGALALAMGLTIATAAIAGDETTIRVRTAGGQVERVTVQDIGAFAVGEGRALTTEAGNYAMLRRETERYVLEVAGERFELQDFAASPGDGGELASHAKGEGTHFVVRKHAETHTAGEEKVATKRFVKVIDGEVTPALAEDDLAADLDALALDGDGPRIAVTRRVTKDSTSQ